MIRKPLTRRRVTRGLAAAALLGAAGCTTGQGSGGDSAAALTSEPVTLRLQQRADPSEQFAHRYAKEFSEKHPNIKVEIEEYPSAEYWTKMLALHASDQLGDLAWNWNSQGQHASWSHLGVVRALDDLARADKYDLGQFYTGAIEAVRYEGKLMAMPTVAHPGEVTVYYNINLFDGAGVKHPTSTWKLDDLLDAARRLTRAPDAWGYSSSRSYFQMMIRLRAFGGDLLSPDGKKTTINAAAAKAALQWEYDTIGRHRVAPPPGDPSYAVAAGFQGGTVAMVGNNVANITNWRKPIADKFKWAATLFPTGPGGKPGTALHTNTISLTRQTKRPREGWELMKLLCSREVGVQKILMESGSPGARPDVWNDKRLHDFEPWYKLGVALMPDARPTGVAYNLRTPEVNTAFQQGLPDIWTGKVAPATGAEQLAQTLQAILDQPR